MWTSVASWDHGAVGRKLPENRLTFCVCVCARMLPACKGPESATVETMEGATTFADGFCCLGHACKRASTCCTEPVALTAGPISSFLVISDPAAAKHVLRATDNPKRPLYNKGLVAEVFSPILDR